MTDSDLDAIDSFHTDALTADPHPYWDHLRAPCPVAPGSHPDVYLVTGYDDIRISEAHPGPADARRWQYTPTWMRRGLDELYF